MKKILVVGSAFYTELLHSKLQETGITIIESTENKQLNNKTMNTIERDYFKAPYLKDLLFQKKEHELFYGGTTKSQQIKRKVLAKRNKRK